MSYRKHDLKAHKARSGSLGSHLSASCSKRSVARLRGILEHYSYEVSVNRHYKAAKPAQSLSSVVRLAASYVVLALLAVVTLYICYSA